MLERYLHAIGLNDAGTEDPAVTRERLKDRFPRGATRRMTQLGLLIGSSLDDLAPRPDDAIVYLSGYAETRALEGYLDSFPTASPTLFQTSIHPSAVQQALIGRQQPITEFLPLTGRAHLVFAGLRAALTSPAPRVLLCGGEERGTWLLDHHLASDRSFAFALALSADPVNALARLELGPDAAPPRPGEPVAYSLPEFFNALAARTSLDLLVAPGMRFILAWL